MKHDWTQHGHKCCPEAALPESTRPRAIARCGGPAICSKCGVQAGLIHAESGHRTGMIDQLEAAEARGYRKAITALREGAKSKLIPPEKAAALSEAVGWLETYLEAIAEEGK